MNNMDQRICFGRPTQKVLFRIILFIALAGLALSVVHIYRYFSYKNTLVQKTKMKAVDTTARVAGEIDEHLRKNMDQARGLADLLSSSDPEGETILARLRGLVDKNRGIFGAGVVFAPFAFNRGTRLFAPYCSKQDETTRCIRIESLYDYTDEEHMWYSEALEKGAVWSEPYVGRAGNALMATYSVPFYRVDHGTKKRTVRGVVAIDVTLDGVASLVRSLDLGQGGYGAVISKRGAYLYHPTREYVGKQKTIFDVARETKDEGKAEAGKKAIAGERGIMEHFSVTTGDSSWYIFEPVPSAGWSLHATFLHDETPLDLDIMRQKAIVIVVFSVIVLLSFFALLFKVYEGDNGKLWKASLVFSIILVTAIGGIWRIALRLDTDMRTEGPRITNQASLANVVESYTAKYAGKPGGDPLYIPTGIFLRSIEFSGANRIAVSGYLWQKYGSEARRSLTPGFVFPDAMDDVKVTESYSIMNGDVLVKGWYFYGTLYERFDYSRYPIDYESIGIRIWHKAIDKNVVLIPDVESYNLMNPVTLPGLDRNFSLSDWEIRAAFFDLRSNAYATNFGTGNYQLQEGYPELSFNIMIQRNLVDAFIRNMTPLFVVALLLFAVMFIMTEEKMSKKFAMDIGENLVFIGSMFFVIIFCHISTRSKIPTQEIFYLEYFYFIMYVALLWVPTSASLYVAEKKSFFVRYRENLMSKLLYWPVILGVLLLITAMTFY